MNQGLTALIEASELPNTRKDIPTRVEHDLILLALDRGERWLGRISDHLEKQFRGDLAIEARSIAKALHDCRDILLVPTRPRSGIEDEPEDNGDE